MRIGILGPGNVGATLGRRFAESGHEIVYGARDLADANLRELLAKHPGRAKAVAPKDLAAASELLVLAVPFGAVEPALASLGALGAKLVVDATNPLSEDLMSLTVGRDDSGGERVARIAPAARVVKAFNTIGFGVMANPRFGERAAFLPVAGDDVDAKRIVIELAKGIGFDARDVGPLSMARYTEPFAMLWIQRAVVQRAGSNFAFALIER